MNESNKFSQYSIDAYHKSRMESLRNSGYDKLEELTVQQIVNIITNYSELGDLYRLSVKYNLTIGAVKTLLEKYNITNQVDAIRLVRSGLVAEFNKDQAKETLEETLKENKEREEKQEMLNSLVKSPVVEKSLEQDKKDAETFNKKIKARQAIEELLKVNQKFKIPVEEVINFKQTIPHGLSALIRHFGGTKQEILNEIRRLVPEFQIDMLRP